MTKPRKGPKAVMHWLTLAAIMVALAIAATAQGSNRFAEFAGAYASPAPESAGEITLIRKTQHECDLGLRIVV